LVNKEFIKIAGAFERYKPPPLFALLFENITNEILSSFEFSLLPLD